ncbi:mechanosensitive ion channel family protein [Marinobacter sp.]|uniref:mechanosensitive ion channel family protein n=1 Tax=Marinobacter sp. TaxID=50741 RepID=UPI0038506F1E
MTLSFIEQLWQQILRNLTDSLDALGVSQLEWSEVALHGLGQLAVSLILVAFFALIYFCIYEALGHLGRQITRLEISVRQVQAGVRYLFLLFTVLALLAQYKVPLDVVQATARAGFIALGFYVLWIVTARILREMRIRYRLDPSIGQLLRNTLSVVLVVLASVTVVSQYGFDVISIVAGLGIVGIAVGFAAQSTLSNFIAGVTLLIERPFHIGDWVRINDQEGKVIRIALRTTWLRTRDNIFTMIPNDSVASSDIINFSAQGEIRLRLPVGIAYKESSSAAREVILPVLENHPNVLTSPALAPRVRMIGLGDSSINLEALAWISQQDIDVRVRISAELYESIKEALDDAGIQIPFPHRQLFIDDAKGLAPVLAPFFSGSGERTGKPPNPDPESES